MEQLKEDGNQYKFCLYSKISSESIIPLIDLVKDVTFGANLNLYINSKGGVVPVAVGVFNFLKAIKGLNVTTYNVGHCDSAATLLFMLGKKRYLLKTSSFYMHSLQVNLVQSQTINSLTTEINNLKEDTRNFIKLLSENSNISQKMWKSFMNDKGTLIKAKKAVELGLANAVIDKL